MSETQGNLDFADDIAQTCKKKNNNILQTLQKNWPENQQHQTQGNKDEHKI